MIRMAAWYRRFAFRQIADQISETIVDHSQIVLDSSVSRQMTVFRHSSTKLRLELLKTLKLHLELPPIRTRFHHIEQSTCRLVRHTGERCRYRSRTKSMSPISQIFGYIVQTLSLADSSPPRVARLCRCGNGKCTYPKDHCAQLRRGSCSNQPIHNMRYHLRFFSTLNRLLFDFKPAKPDLFGLDTSDLLATINNNCSAKAAQSGSIVRLRAILLVCGSKVGSAFEEEKAKRIIVHVK